MFFVPESSACLHFSKIYNLENVLDAAPYPNNYMVEIAAWNLVALIRILTFNVTN